MTGSASFRAGKCSLNRSRPVSWLGACLTLAAWVAPASAYEPDKRYLFMTAPLKQSVYQIELPNLKGSSVAPEDAKPKKAQMFIDGATAKNSCNGTCAEDSDQGLVQPEGIAVWHGKDQSVLFVADTGASKIYRYDINVALGEPVGLITAGPQMLVSGGKTGCSGLALDGFGNLYYTTSDGTVGMLARNQWKDPKATPVQLYRTETQKTVSNPVGIAANAFHVFWSNSANGQTAGTIVKAFERDAVALAKKYPDYPKVLAKNVPKAMGVCLANNNVFFTGETQFLYGVKATGGSIAEVYKQFNSPRGCAYDGENTLYVADLQGIVFSLPANFPTLRPVKRMRQVATVESPFGLAVFTSAMASGDKM